MTLDERYARQVRLAEVGARGQARLLAGAASVSGTGAAAEEAALYLCAAGVGRLVLEADLAARMAGRLAELNPDVSLVTGAVDAVSVTPADADRRADGARAALLALIAIADAGSARDWEETRWEATT